MGNFCPKLVYFLLQHLVTLDWDQCCGKNASIFLKSIPDLFFFIFVFLQTVNSK